MKIIAKIGELLSGGLGSKIVDTVKDYFPPSMSDEQKAEVKFRIMEASHQHEIAIYEAAMEAEIQLTNRIKDLEGTAKDLKGIPIIGPAMLFMRGCQRPIFGFFTLLMDYCVFSGIWVIAEGSRLESAFLAINILVLGFLFGERAVRNVLPMLERYTGKGSRE